MKNWAERAARGARREQQKTALTGSVGRRRRDDPVDEPRERCDPREREDDGDGDGPHLGAAIESVPAARLTNERRSRAVLTFVVLVSGFLWRLQPRQIAHLIVFAPCQTYVHTFTALPTHCHTSRVPKGKLHSLASEHKGSSLCA